MSPVKPVMGAEDFSLYSQGTSDLHVLAGIVESRTTRGVECKRREPACLHSSKYYPEPREHLERRPR